VSLTGIEIQAVVRTEDRTPDGVVTVRATGEIDIVGAPLLRRAASQELAASPRALILDLSGVSFLAAAGVGALAFAVRRAAERGVPVRVVASNRVVLRVLELTGTDRLVPIHATEDRAVATLRGQDHTSAVAEALLNRTCR
jgi:anti-sigma B factor antagonist